VTITYKLTKCLSSPLVTYHKLLLLNNYPISNLLPTNLLGRRMDDTGAGETPNHGRDNSPHEDCALLITKEVFSEAMDRFALRLKESTRDSIERIAEQAGKRVAKAATARVEEEMRQKMKVMRVALMKDMEREMILLISKRLREVLPEASVTDNRTLKKGEGVFITLAVILAVIGTFLV
ncbi:hypothetical protein F4806DRAFT_502918, partial [Annulohypoxylon nitens]